MVCCGECFLSYTAISFILSFNIGMATQCPVQPFIGIPQSKLPLYLPKKEFVCFDGSLTIPYDWINDDFCDCADGSDEPSTSACPDARFYCANLGYRSTEIPSSRVNDGICDCCDGSDEYCTNANCTNTCQQLKAVAMARLEKHLELLTKGNAIRNEMIIRGQEIKIQKAIRLSELEIELKGAEEIKRDAEKLKQSWELKEKELLGQKIQQDEAEEAEITLQIKPEDVFNEMDENGDSMLQANEVLIKLKSLEICESKIKSTVEDEVMYIMNMNSELSFGDFVELSWNRFKVLLASSDGDRRTDKHYNIKADAIGKKYDKETKKVINESINAREIYEKAEKAVKGIEDHKAYILNTLLEQDFGKDDEFLALEGQCFSFMATSYNYTVCLFDQVIQTGLSGGCEIKLGLWDRWETPGNYSVMIYSNGEECWNGPKRSAKVIVSCGLENQLIAAEEPDKCFYVLHFKTPAACSLNKIKEANSFVHDEL